MARRVLTLIVTALALTTEARAQSGENVLLVANRSSAVSIQIADRYARARAVPQDNVLRLAVDRAEQIPRATFEREIERPIAAWIAGHAAHDRILYIVLTKDIPLRIAGTSGRNGTVASVDSELTLLYRRMAGQAVPPAGRVPNPYFLGDRSTADAKSFTHDGLDIYLVARLDGFSLADALALIDRAATPARTGRVALDEKLSLAGEMGNRWLERAADILRRTGPADRVLLEATSRPLSNEGDLLGYYSWGSNDPSIKDRRLTLGFAPGGLAAAFVSTDARTFHEPPPTWSFGRWEQPATYFEGSPQSLAGDLIRDGATGVAGHVAEPFLDATIRPDILFPAYFAGFNLVESFYLAMPYLSWQTVVIGDPLCAPFRTRTLSASEIDRGVDRSTELPTLFSARALALAPPAATPDAVQLLLKAHARIDRGDRAGARHALEQATAVDGRFVQAHILLATLYEQAGEPDKAIARYRAAVDVAPAHVVALNNLAYLLATTRSDAFQEALTHARKAFTLAKNNPSIADTLAWILHLAGDDREARGLLAGIVRLVPDDPTIQLHAAIVDAAAGALDAASRELARALALDPGLETHADVQQLRAALPRSKS